MHNQAAQQNPGENLHSWQASEYVAHARKPGWYIALIGATALMVGGLIYFGEWFSAVVVVLMATAIWVYARRSPQVLDYSLRENGVQIGEKFHAYDVFRSFTVMADKGWYVVELEPTRRFMPRLSVFLDPDNLDRVIDILATRLPHEEREPDLIDRLSHKLKF